MLTSSVFTPVPSSDSSNTTSVHTCSSSAVMSIKKEDDPPPITSTHTHGSTLESRRIRAFRRNQTLRSLALTEESNHIPSEDEREISNLSEEPHK